jgi:CBS domain-containing protein
MSAHASQGILIRTRETIDAAGEVSSVASVDCPREKRVKHLSDCMECSQFARLGHLDAEHVLICNHHDRPRSTPPWEKSTEPGCAIAANEIPLSAVMRAGVVCVSPDMPTSAVLSLMLERGFGGVPVVDTEGRPIGLVSKTDLLRQFAADEESNNGGASTPDRTVGESMTPLTIALPPSASVAQAAALMASQGLHRLPVVSEKGEVVGIISPLDILHLVATLSGYDLG